MSKFCFAVLSDKLLADGLHLDKKLHVLKPPSYALVIGNNTAELWSAYVLADHSDRVTVVAGDRLLSSPH